MCAFLIVRVSFCALFEYLGVLFVCLLACLFP